MKQVINFQFKPVVEGSHLRIVAMGGLGDHLMVTPFIRYFNRSGKYDKISCAVHLFAKELFDKNPFIDQLGVYYGDDRYLWCLPEKDCDLFLYTHRITPPKEYVFGMKVQDEPVLRLNEGDKHAILQLADYHGIQLEDSRPEIYTTGEDVEWAENFLSRWAGSPIVFLNRTSNLPEKNYPAPLWDKVIALLRDRAIILELREPSTPAFVKAIDPWPGIRSSAELLRRCRCVLTVDSFPAHLAAAVHTPAVVVFGPSNPKAWGYPGNQNIRIDACEPCFDTPGKSRCQHPSCLEKIPPEMVAQAVIDAAGL